jgi:hypothetical protein
MAPRRKIKGSSVDMIPPINPNSQLPFCGNYKSSISESELLRLVRMVVFPPKELSLWRVLEGVIIPTEDTHEFVIFAPFLIRGLGLPISSFFRGLLNYYSINLNHLNPNSILEIVIFVHLNEAFLGIAPHFGLWRYLYYCKSGMVNGHQVVRGASLELHWDRKAEYLDIPLKDNVNGWRFEWFTMENHNNSLTARSRRQLDVWVPSWIEDSTDSEISKARALFNEIANLKDRGLIAETVMIDFIFKNIQSLKDWVHPAYLYTGARDPSPVTKRVIIEEDVLGWVEMMLIGAIINEGAPQAYFVWNLPVLLDSVTLCLTITC